MLLLLNNITVYTKYKLSEETSKAKLNARQLYRILKELYMLDLPKLRVPEVSVSLAENLVTVESLLSRMTVEASYVLCRNESAVVYMAKDLRETSPFSLQQVQKTGEITLVFYLSFQESSLIMKLMWLWMYYLFFTVISMTALCKRRSNIIVLLKDLL